MPLIKSLDLPGGMGQHFFFDAGNGDCVAFFWFADAPDRVPGISSPAALPGYRRNHQRREHDEPPGLSRSGREVRRVPAAAQGQGVRVGPVLNHDESEAQVSPTVHPGVYVRSFYFNDPDGITLEFACWTKEFTENDTGARPRTAADRRAPSRETAAAR